MAQNVMMEPHQHTPAHARLLVWLLVTATVLVDCVALTIYGDGEPHNAFLEILGISQISLVAMWLALGHVATVWRVLGMVATIEFWAIAVASTHVGMNVIIVLPHFVALAMLAFIPMGVGRTLGVCVSFQGASEEGDRGNRLRRGQFSIGDMLVWMTVVAITLGTLSWLAPLDSWLWNHVGRNGRGMVAKLSFAAISWTAVWAALGCRSPTLRIAAFVLVVAIGIGIFHFVWPLDAPVSKSGVIPAIGLLAFLNVGSLYVVRVAGYRLRYVGANGDARVLPDRESP